MQKKNFKNKNKVGKLILPNFKTYCETTVNKTLWQWQKDTQINGTEWSPEIDPNVYGQLIFYKVANVIQIEESTDFSTNGPRTAGFYTRRKMNSYLKPHTKI